MIDHVTFAQKAIRPTTKLLWYADYKILCNLYNYCSYVVILCQVQSTVLARVLGVRNRNIFNVLKINATAEPPHSKEVSPNAKKELRINLRVYFISI